ncbi:Spo0E family sporulation regulatory protein-aspartic acid phosphatase [Virgibacillus sp. JSM 102003]|uniref:Spo0E family sporulation regulatory protein-aspartic acid phosphatase n=1 Tax=Virgibacillus sp. JSM 102003 TaxID=1562108 RepID=UPI0035C0249F
MCTTEKLLERIEFLRNKMTDVAFEKGFTSVESINISQELDRLLNLFDDVKKTKHQRRID